MVIIGSSTKLFTGVGLAVLTVPRIGNGRLGLCSIRRGTSEDKEGKETMNSLDAMN